MICCCCPAGVPPHLTETASLQRHQLRSRIIELGSADVAERCLEDVRLVDSAAINLRRHLPHIWPRMDRGLPVRFFLSGHGRALIPARTHTRTHLTFSNQSGLRRQPSSAHAQPAFRRPVLRAWQIPNVRRERLAGDHPSQPLGGPRKFRSFRSAYVWRSRF